MIAILHFVRNIVIRKTDHRSTESNLFETPSTRLNLYNYKHPDGTLVSATQLDVTPSGVSH
jgi:hypothetical protein